MHAVPGKKQIEIVRQPLLSNISKQFFQTLPFNVTQSSRIPKPFGKRIAVYLQFRYL